MSRKWRDVGQAPSDSGTVEPSEAVDPDLVLITSTLVPDESIPPWQPVGVQNRAGY
jgi:hypothetical protein